MANVEGWSQLADLAIALGLSSAIGLGEEVRGKDAGLRTNALVGTGAALFMLISKFGFSDVVQPQRVQLDPSRVAAQIVSGIGFIGAGLIFVQDKDRVRGLTTAANVWLTAAIGAAAGAALPLLAIAATVGDFAVLFGYTAIARRITGARDRRA